MVRSLMNYFIQPIRKEKEFKKHLTLRKFLYGVDNLESTPYFLIV